MNHTTSAHSALPRQNILSIMLFMILATLLGGCATKATLDGKLITKELLLQKDVLGISIRECVASSSKGALLILMNQSKGVDELF